MRILAIAPTAFYNDYGCHIRIRGQLCSLQARGHTIRLITYPAGRDVAELDVVRGPGLRQMPVGSSRRKLLLDALLGPAVLQQALRFRPHVVYTYLHEGMLMGAMLASWLRKPWAADYQGSLTAEMLTHHFLRPHSIWLRPLQWLEHWLERRPQAVLASTEQGVQTLRTHGIEAQRLHHLPDAVDPELFHPQERDAGLAGRLGLHPGRPTLVYLGLLASYQGIDLLLHAVARLAQPVNLLLMGFPHERRYKKLAQTLGIAEQVILTGAIPYVQAPRYLALGQLALSPKLPGSEGSGKLLPYMSMALPVLATESPAHRAYLAEDGLFAAPQPDAWARALHDALARLPTLRPRGQGLRERVLQRYTWQHTAAQMERVFRALG
jgi:glycosyltransferase involved in cell wall biosynthesis